MEALHLLQLFLIDCINSKLTLTLMMIHDRNLLPEEDVDELILIALRLCLRTRLKGEAY